MINILVWGINGKMGKVLVDAINDDNDFNLVGGFDRVAQPEQNIFNSVKDITVKPDVVIDFSLPTAMPELVEFCYKTKTPLVMATTGHSDKGVEFIEKLASSVAVFKSGNMSVGINLLVDLIEQAVKKLGDSFDIEIVEKHHNLKADAPSGTALMLAKSANVNNDKELCFGRHGADAKRKSGEIGIHAVRGGTIAGEHEVILAGSDEVITLSHYALSKKIFALGALKASKLILNKPAGLYSFKNI